MKNKSLSKENLLKTRIVLLVLGKVITLEEELSLIQYKINERYNTFYLQEEIEAEIIDIKFEETKEEKVLVPEDYVMSNM